MGGALGVGMHAMLFGLKRGYYGALRYARRGIMGLRISPDILWCEIKRRGQKPKAHQIKWHEAERALGAQVCVIDDFDFFREGYVKSGLNRSIRA